MRIIFLSWNCFNGEATQKAMKEQGHTVLLFSHKDYNDRVSDDFNEKFIEFAKKNRADLAFSYNYYPVMAEACHQIGLRYISVVYDNPAVYLYSFTLMYETNHVYVFDSDWVREFNAGGLTNVHYATLPGDIGRMKLVEKDASKKYFCDISFVGALYNERHNFYERMEGNLSEHMRGFLEGLMDAQSLVYGSDIIKPALTNSVLDELERAIPIHQDTGSAEPRYYRFLKYVIGRKLTSLERIKYLTALGKKYSIDLYTLDQTAQIPGVRNHGLADYDTIMPLVFGESRINLNMTLRSITSGIPQRCIDIMSCGGFLLTNYQADFFTDTITDDGSAAFVPGVDYDYFSSVDELIEKTGYYLSHEDERARIARNGFEKVKRYYSIDTFLKRILTESCK